MRKILLALILLVLAPNAMAQEVTKPSFLKSYIKAEKPAGSATLRKLFIKVYDAQLWVDGDSWSYSKPFALSLTYDVRIDTEDFVERTFDEIEASSHLKKEQLAQFDADLRKAFPDVSDGDNITALYVPNKAVMFYYNGKETHQIKDMQFAKYFFDIWLSENTTEPDFRQKLMAGLHG